MKTSYPVRTVQLGIVPVLTRLAKESFPEASASLWQRDAKRAHRRIMSNAPDLPDDGPVARHAAAVYTIAALMLAFHETSPAGVDMTEGDFARLVSSALATPIVGILLSGGSVSREADVRALASYLSSVDEQGKHWEGEVEATGRGADGDSGLAVRIATCGLAAMCIAEKRYYLLKHLCMIEEAYAAASGADLDRPSCIALNDRRCELLLTKR